MPLPSLTPGSGALTTSAFTARAGIQRYGVPLDRLTVTKGRIKLNRDGTMTVTEIGFCGAEHVAALIPPQYSPHPVYTACQLDYDTSDITTDDGYADFTLSYIGTAGGASTWEQTEPTFQFMPDDTHDPIETHSRFVSELGGTWKEPIETNSYVTRFDPNFPHQFMFFAVPDGANFAGDVLPSDCMAGVKSYFNPCVTVHRNYISRTQPVVNVKPYVIGLNSIPGLNVSKVHGLADDNYNWLVLPSMFSRSGGVYPTTERYKLSGFRGWNPRIYGQPV